MDGIDGYRRYGGAKAFLGVADPLGGSWYVEQLTDRIEADAEKIFERIRERGLAAHPDGRHPIGPMTSGILRGIEDGWFTGEIAESAFRYQQALEKGEKRVVGVNVHTGSVTGDLEILRVGHEVERAQVRVLGERRKRRDDGAVRTALAGLLAAARDGSNMIAPMLAAVRAEATLGEICGALREEWGVYTEPAGF